MDEEVVRSIETVLVAERRDTTDKVTAGKVHPPSIQLLRKAIRIAGKVSGILKALRYNCYERPSESQAKIPAY